MWVGSAGALAALAALAAAVGLVAGLVAGLIAFIAGLLALGWHHLRNLERLVRWTHDPVGTPTPRAVGVWSQAFTDLGRRTRLAYDLRERMAAALERFREASQAMPDGVLYLSESDCIEWINEKAEQHFGLDHSRDLGVPVTKLVRQPEFVRYLQSGLHAEPLMMQSSRRPGLTLLVQVVPFGDEQRMIVSRDITHIEKLETVRRDFVANVSHELRTPLTVVAGFLETLLDGADDLGREDTRRYLQLALEQATRMQRLIEDLLALSALETGAPAPAEEQVEVASLVREVHHETELLSAGRHEVEIDIEEHGEEDLVTGSYKELHSAFANLASNAVRYTPAGGRLRLTWRRLPGGGGEFAVEDNGIGIDPQHIPRLTERFYRVDRGRSRETGGTGLGLAIVKHVLSRHHAELRVTSELGKGSRFSVRFPAVRFRSPQPSRS